MLYMIYLCVHILQKSHTVDEAHAVTLFNFAYAISVSLNRERLLFSFAQLVYMATRVTCQESKPKTTRRAANETRMRWSEFFLMPKRVSLLQNTRSLTHTDRKWRTHSLVCVRVLFLSLCDGWNESEPSRFTEILSKVMCAMCLYGMSVMETRF